ncbi:hypothetical protein ASE36_02515 [Rhizobium sp. Root274]|nr:hypothetical protein ASC71_02510 [Rhizobium sp. Root1240]KRD32717.1 hypothetical protein ASE36_02515 [Rhizobium sp. Root274]
MAPPPPSRRNPLDRIPLKHPPAVAPIPLGRIKRPVGGFQQALVVGGGAHGTTGSTDADGDVAVAVFRVVVADAELIMKGLPPRLCRRADPATARKMRSKPVAVS